MLDATHVLPTVEIKRRPIITSSVAMTPSRAILLVTDPLSISSTNNNVVRPCHLLCKKAHTTLHIYVVETSELIGRKDNLANEAVLPDIWEQMGHQGQNQSIDLSVEYPVFSLLCLDA